MPASEGRDISPWLENSPPMRASLHHSKGGNRHFSMAGEWVFRCAARPPASANQHSEEQMVSVNV
jgi:hypothetical protein